MKIFVGLDVAGEVHWACAVTGDAEVLFSRPVANEPEEIAALIAEIDALEAGDVTVALDILGGTATLLCAMIAETGFRLLHTPGLAVNRARRGMRGGETKSDPRDAAMIAEPARTRPDLRRIDAERGIDVNIRLPVAPARRHHRRADTPPEQDARPAVLAVSGI